MWPKKWRNLYGISILILGLYPFTENKAQEQGVDAALNLRIKPWEIGIHTGIFKDKILNSPYKFSNSATLLEFSLPFYWAMLPKDQDISLENANPVFKIKPSILTMLLSTGSTALGFSNLFSFKIFDDLYLNYNLGFVWVMTQTSKGEGDGMQHGLNFLHFFSLQYELQKRFHLVMGMTHISNGKILSSGLDSSNSDALLIGVRYSLNL